MFKFLKDKLKDWTEKVSKKAEVVNIEESPKKKKVEKTQKKKKEEIKVENIKLEKIHEDIEPVTERKSFFKRITEKISKVRISERDFNEYSEELEMLLLENNVAFEVSDEIIKKLKKDIVESELSKKSLEDEIKKMLKKIIGDVLLEPFDIIKKVNEKKKAGEPYVILFCGINGSGKTTTVAKVASFLKRKGLSCVLAAGDTFRAASIEQLKKHGENLNIKVISQDYGSDPAAVGFDAINYAKKNKIECVLIDTAGRMHTAKNLLKEMEKIVRICKPDTKIFIGESITGNDSVDQVRSFDETVGVDGIILTKADIDEKGGTALSIGYVTKKPILYIGTGQEYDKIEAFDKDKFIERLGL